METPQWESAMARIYPKALIYARSRLGHWRQDAADVVQESLTWAWEHRGEYKEGTGLSLESWLLNRVILGARNYRRDRLYWLKKANGMPCSMRMQGDMRQDMWAKEGVEAAWTLLPPCYRGIAERIYLGGETQKAACEAEGVNRHMYGRAWKRLKARLKRKIGSSR
jgi:DNA-directed RNA polymerase specialized sigma24 family protein